MNEKRKNYSASRKVLIVRELLEGGYSVSEISEKYHIHPTQLVRWKKQLFEGASEIFNRSNGKVQERFDREVEALRSKLTQKDSIIVELLEENLQLKKNDGVH